jgi:hypothetical protein
MKQGDPMKGGCCFPNARQCTATSKRTKMRCKAPALRGWSVCRFHGAKGGGPTGERNGAYRHGHYTKKSIEDRRRLSALMRECRKQVMILGG